MSAVNVMASDPVSIPIGGRLFASQASGLDGLMSEAVFCQRIKICRASLFKLRKAGLIGFVTKGKRIFYDEQSYRDYLANCTKRVGAANASGASAIKPRKSARRGIRRRNG